MSTLLLRLAAPLQSWGIESKFDTRQTLNEPSKSGIIGMIAAAMGIRRDDDAALQRLNGLRFGVRVDREGRLMRDLHTARSDKTSYLTYRYYLADAVFLVGLEHDDEAYLQEIAEALHNPVFPLFLGRRSCPPTLPLVLKIVNERGLEEALNAHPWLSPPVNGRTQETLVRLIIDAAGGAAGAERRKDAPVSFDPTHRKYGYRMVAAHGFAQVQAENYGQDETGHDAMAELR